MRMKRTRGNAVTALGVVAAGCAVFAFGVMGASGDPQLVVARWIVLTDDGPPGGRPAPVATRPAQARYFAAILNSAAAASSQVHPEVRPLPSGGDRAPQQPPAVPPGMRAKTVRMRVTAYCSCEICCGRCTGITASGRPVSANGGRFAAASDGHLLSAGAMVSVAGYNGGRPVPVIDRMAAEGPGRLDVFFRSHQKAREWGVKWMDVTVYLPAGSGSQGAASRSAG